MADVTLAACMSRQFQEGEKPLLKAARKRTVKRCLRAARLLCRPTGQSRAVRVLLLVIMIICVGGTAPGESAAEGKVKVYRAQGAGGESDLYAILQPLPAPPPELPVPQSWRSGTLMRVLITAGPTARGRAGARSCQQCTAQHLFLLPTQLPAGAHRKLRVLRDLPGRATYLELKGKEFALFHIRVLRAGDGLRLTGATLMRTGFVPPVLKKRVRLHFNAPLADGPHRDGIVATALAETEELPPGAH